MSVSKDILVFINLFFIVNLVQCTEFVPVYMWSTSKTNEKVPALHKISQDSFKEDLLEHLKGDPFIIVFAEQTLSPEDFNQRDQSGEVVFPNLSKLKKSSKVSYLPYVQNPIKTLKHLDEEDVTEFSITSLRKKSIDIPDTDILIIDLNDAEDDEHRLDMLKRHDADIHSIYQQVLKTHDNVLAIYTARHTSWVAPEGVVNSRKVRSAPEPRAAQLFNSTYALVYLTNSTYRTDLQNPAVTNVTFTFTDSRADDNINLTATSTEPALVVDFTFNASRSVGYWELAKLLVAYNNTEYALNSSLADVYAPHAFSYHCGDQVFTNSKDFELTLTSFQIQLFFNGTNNVSRFADAYDCIGFTSVPIWAGIFVTTILLLILSFGITMMMDIRTMDRFDDAKGKTITINAE